MMNWPDDDDGDVLRLLEKSKFNFSKEYEIDFNIDFDHWPLNAREIVEIKNLYPGCDFIDPDEEDIEEGNLNGYVQFKVKSQVTYDFVTQTQKKVTEQVQIFGGWCESWGVLSS